MSSRFQSFSRTILLIPLHFLYIAKWMFFLLQQVWANYPVPSNGKYLVVIFKLPFYRYENRGTQSLRNLPKVIELVKNCTNIEIKICLTSEYKSWPGMQIHLSISTLKENHRNNGYALIVLLSYTATNTFHNMYVFNVCAILEV